MSRIISTEYGRLNIVRDGDAHRVLLEIPGCGKWEPVNDDQLAGRVSVNHGAVCECGYHETHDFETDARAKATAASPTFGDPFEEI